jgi:hypothetical protein
MEEIVLDEQKAKSNMVSVSPAVMVKKGVPEGDSSVND